jgi:hypothetical protein
VELGLDPPGVDGEWPGLAVQFRGEGEGVDDAGGRWHRGREGTVGGADAREPSYDGSPISSFMELVWDFASRIIESAHAARH